MAELSACASHAPRPDSANHGLMASTAPGAQALLERALAMRGQPYRYGGAAPGGFDCSGLIFYAASAAGLAVPRTAQEQQHLGLPVGRHELKAGDLVFLHLRHKELHVGIALDADRFIHAPASGGHVRIDSLQARPYVGAFLGARRIAFPP
jgi:cell wall-associated NlpC family hydrolase